MNQGQSQFFQFILERVKEGSQAAAEALLGDSFARQAAGTFDAEHMKDFGAKITDMLKPEHVEEVMAIMRQFGSQHVSK